MSEIDIDQLANLSLLNIANQERDKLVKGVVEVLDYVKKVQEIDTNEYIPVTVSVRKLRQDEVGSCVDQQLLIDSFSDRQGDLLKTSAINGKEGSYDA